MMVWDRYDEDWWEKMMKNFAQTYNFQSMGDNRHNQLKYSGRCWPDHCYTTIMWIIINNGIIIPTRSNKECCMSDSELNLAGIMVIGHDLMECIGMLGVVLMQLKWLLSCWVSFVVVVCVWVAIVVVLDGIDTDSHCDGIGWGLLCHVVIVIWVMKWWGVMVGGGEMLLCKVDENWEWRWHCGHCGLMWIWDKALAMKNMNIF